MGSILIVQIKSCLFKTTLTFFLRPLSHLDNYSCANPFLPYFADIYENRWTYLWKCVKFNFQLAQMTSWKYCFVTPQSFFFVLYRCGNKHFIKNIQCPFNINQCYKKFWNFFRNYWHVNESTKLCKNSSQWWTIYELLVIENTISLHISSIPFLILSPKQLFKPSLFVKNWM